MRGFSADLAGNAALAGIDLDSGAVRRTIPVPRSSSELQHLLSDDVVAALHALPEEFRTVVMLCDLEGLAYKEIADAIGRPVGTVMSRLYRGRRLLERRLHALAVERGIVKAGEAAPEPQAEVLNINRYRRRRA